MNALWSVRSLADVCEIASALVDPRTGSNRDLLHVGGANIESNTGRLFDLQTASDEGLISGKFLFDERMVLYSKIRPYLKKVARPEFQGLCSADIYPLLPKNGQLDRGFLYYSLLSDDFTSFAVAGSGRAGMPKVNREHLFAYRLPTPTLSEQRRIVGILDETFDDIAKAKINAEKNLQNSRAVFESRLNTLFTDRGEGWIEKQLGELVTFRNGINFTKASRGEAVKIVGVKDFGENFWVPFDELATVVTDGALPDLDTIRTNDLLFVRSNGSSDLIGRCLLVGDVPERTTHSGFTIKARLSDDRIFAPYLCRVLKSDHVRQTMIDGGIGANIKSLSQGTLAMLRIPLPSRPQQERICEQFDALEAESELLEGIYRRKVNALDELKMSLLHHALSGLLGARC